MFSKDLLKGDRGGNGIHLRRGQNLHSYWDSRLGSGDSERFLNQLAETIQRRHPEPQELVLKPEQWVNESFALRQKVYAFTGTGTKNNRPS
jgi:hypothetical protein